MKKLNNKGYMLVEIIMAFAITFALIYFLMDMVINLKNKNDDLLVDTVIKTDQTIISNKLMDYIIEDTSGDESIKFKCENITVDKQAIMYNGNVLGVVDDSAMISYNPSTDCSNINGKIHINIPVEIKQMSDKNYNIVVDYRYKLVYCNPIKSYNCKDQYGNWRFDTSKEYAFEYDGWCEVIDDGDKNWRVKFLAVDEHNFKSNCEMLVDVFLVGGGSGGKGCTGAWNGDSGGAGGNGGYTFTTRNITLSPNIDYSIVIGKGGESGGGSGNASSAFGYTASGGTSRGGGSGGGSGGFYGGTYRCGAGGNGSSDGEGSYGQKSVIGPNGETGSTREFGEEMGTLYAGGGGGGGARNPDPYNYCSGSNGTGGEGGGGTAGNNSLVNGKDNTGGGGAGCKTRYSTGKGGSGIVIIRNAR